VKTTRGLGWFFVSFNVASAIVHVARDWQDRGWLAGVGTIGLIIGVIWTTSFIASAPIDEIFVVERVDAPAESNLQSHGAQGEDT
jgi:hypothetical protein